MVIKARKVITIIGAGYVMYVFAFLTWSLTERDPCALKPLRPGEMAWGAGAFHPGIGDCIKYKRWWQW